MAEADLGAEYLPVARGGNRVSAGQGPGIAARRIGLQCCRRLCAILEHGLLHAEYRAYAGGLESRLTSGSARLLGLATIDSEVGGRPDGSRRRRGQVKWGHLRGRRG